MQRLCVGQQQQTADSLCVSLERRRVATVMRANKMAAEGKEPIKMNPVEVRAQHTGGGGWLGSGGGFGRVLCCRRDAAIRFEQSWCTQTCCWCRQGSAGLF